MCVLQFFVKNEIFQVLNWKIFPLFQQQQQFAELGRKQLEQVLQQLQEQLQLNLIQQTHLLHTGDKKKASVPLQQLSMQQQQLVQQLRIVQHQFLMQQGLVQPMMVAQGAGDALGQTHFFIQIFIFIVSYSFNKIIEVFSSKRELSSLKSLCFMKRFPSLFLKERTRESVNQYCLH